MSQSRGVPVTHAELVAVGEQLVATMKAIVEEKEAASGSLTNYSLRDVTHYARLYATLLAATPVEFATPRQQRAMRRTLDRVLPRRVRKIIGYVATERADLAYELAKHGLPRKMFARMQATAMVSKHVAALTQARQPLVLEASRVPAGERPLVFPLLAPVSVMVDAAVHELAERWEKTRTMPSLTSEDRFVVEQIATTYLPDSWRMFGSLQGLTPQTVAEGESLLLTQVHDLTARLDGMQQQEGSSALQALRAQTDFIGQHRRQATQEHPLHLD